MHDGAAFPRRVIALPIHPPEVRVVKTVELAWHAGTDQFVATGGGGVTLVLDAPPGAGGGSDERGDRVAAGPSPSELLLVAAGGCTAWDLVEILRKQRQDVTEIAVRVSGGQDAEPPWAYRTVHLAVRVQGHALDPNRVERATRLAIDRYCSVVATIRGVADVTSTTIVDERGPR